MMFYIYIYNMCDSCGCNVSVMWEIPDEALIHSDVIAHLFKEYNVPTFACHDEVMTWKCSPQCWHFLRGINRWRDWRESTSCWTNNRGNLKHLGDHVTSLYNDDRSNIDTSLFPVSERRIFLFIIFLRYDFRTHSIRERRRQLTWEYGIESVDYGPYHMRQ